MVDKEIDNGSCLNFLTILELPMTALEWESMAMHKHVLKGELRSILTLSSFFCKFGVLSVQRTTTKIGVAYTVLSSF